MEKIKEIKKEYYTVKVEAMVPITTSYRVLAETPEQAIELAKKLEVANSPAISWHRMKRLKATVYMAGTSLIKLSKVLS